MEEIFKKTKMELMERRRIYQRPRKHRIKLEIKLRTINKMVIAVAQRVFNTENLTSPLQELKRIRLSPTRTVRKETVLNPYVRTETSGLLLLTPMVPALQEYFNQPVDKLPLLHSRYHPRTVMLLSQAGLS